MLYSRHADVWGKAAGPSALGILRERAFRDERRLSARSKAIRASGDPASLEISVASLELEQSQFHMYYEYRLSYTLLDRAD